MARQEDCSIRLTPDDGSTSFLNGILGVVFHSAFSPFENADFKTGNQGDLYAVFVYTQSSFPQATLRWGNVL